MLIRLIDMFIHLLFVIFNWTCSKLTIHCYSLIDTSLLIFTYTIMIF